MIQIDRVGKGSLLSAVLICCLFTGGCNKKEENEAYDTILESRIQETAYAEQMAAEAGYITCEEEGGIHSHRLVTQWYGEAPDCSHGGYQIVICEECGWVDEEAGGKVPPLEHISQGEEIQHGNCTEDTVIVYICSFCGEQTGYERHTEPGEHKWVVKEAEVWDEAALSFQKVTVECCERCNARP